MNELQVFNNAQFGEIRMIEEDGKVLFCAKDIATALGYAVPKDAITAYCKGAVKRRLLTNGGEQDAKFIPEGDVYRLITHSKLPGAEQFESWIFDEVLPAIRKTGKYEPCPTCHSNKCDTSGIRMTQVYFNNCYRRFLNSYQSFMENFQDFEKCIKYYSYFMADFIEDIKQLEKENNELCKTISNNKYKLDFYDAVCNADNLYTIEAAAKLYSSEPFIIGRNQFADWLVDNAYLTRKTLLPYQKWIDKGLFKVCLVSKNDDDKAVLETRTYITANGLQYLFSELKMSFSESKLPTE